MKKIQWVIGIILGVILVPVLLITSVEYVVSKDSFFIKEYQKYNITQTVGISQEDLMEVTHQMMSYLVGERETLDDINANIKGTEREFFNDREKSHMADVRMLFLGALTLRKVLLCIMVALIVALFFTKGGGFYVLAKAIQIVPVTFLAVGALLGWVISTDFTKYFTVFHEMFFNNDLWILDPATDLLINIVPEPFFIDTAKNIGIVFALCMVLLVILGAVAKRFMDRQKNMGV